MSVNNSSFSFLPILVIATLLVSLIVSIPPARTADINVPVDHTTIQAAINATSDGDVVIVAQDTYPENIDFSGKAITVRSTDPNAPSVVASTIIDGRGAGSVVTFNNNEGSNSILSGFTLQNGGSLGLIGYWKFDDAAGLTAADFSAINNNGTLTNTGLDNPEWIKGVLNSALRFERVNGDRLRGDFVEVPHIDNYLVDEGTVAFWFRTFTSDWDVCQGLWSKDSGGSDTGGHLTISINEPNHLARGPAYEHIRFRLQTNSPSKIVYSSAVIETNTWYHLAATFGSQGMKLYLNGVLDNTDPYTGGLGTTSGGIGNYEPIVIGANSQASDDLLATPIWWPLDGDIDDVRFYNRALSASEIDDLYRSVPMGYWNFDDGAGSVTAADFSANNNNGTLTKNGTMANNPTWITTGVFEDALEFTRIDNFNGSYVEIPHIDDYLVDNGTVAFWFNATDNVETGQGLWSKDSYDYDTGGHITIKVGDPGAHDHYFPGSDYNSTINVRMQHVVPEDSPVIHSNTITTNTWYHFAFTFGSQGMKLYLNGNLDATDPYTGGLGTTSGDIGNYEPIVIGADSWGSGNSTATPIDQPFTGFIDEVRFYRRALTQDEINDLYRNNELSETIDSLGGGGIFCDSASPIVTNCIITENISSLGGGGIYCSGSCTPNFNKCIISENITTTWGGGILTTLNTTPSFINCIIAKNTAALNGGGICSQEYAVPSIINCTIYGNNATQGGGIHCIDGVPVISNCIFWDDIPDEISGLPSVTYSDIEIFYPGAGNINFDPRFVNPALGDYRIRSGSPCIDTGTNSNAPAEDIRGATRPKENGYDMGAFEGPYKPSSHKTPQLHIIHR